MALGADVVGGIPWIEATPADQEAHVEWACALAARLGRRVAMLTDDAPDPAYDTTRMLAEAMRRHGLEGRGVACHARAVGHYTRGPAGRVARPGPRGRGWAWSATRTPARSRYRWSGRWRAGVAVALGRTTSRTRTTLRPAQPAGGGLPRRAPAGHALGAPAGDCSVDLVTTSAARVLGLPVVRPPRGRPGRPARARRHADGRPARPARAAAGVVRAGRVLSCLSRGRPGCRRPSRPGARRAARSRGR